MKTKMNHNRDWVEAYNAGVESAATMLRINKYPHLGKLVKSLKLKLPDTKIKK